VELGAKRLGLLHELLPGGMRFAVLVQENSPNERMITDMRAAASGLGLQIEVLSVGTNRDIDMAFATLPQKRVDALLTATSALFGARRLQLTTLAAHYSMPVMYHDRLFTESGGLMSYGTSLADIYRQVGVYTGRVLEGEKPADLPVLQPTKLELVINLQAARTIGIDVPPALLATADEVIE
jgi:putative ABC transport system substrate-binding protein